ncbi:structural maintenance of chromosome 3 [Actinidia rufa]|uniref:Structural maintenance of chromosome 3 n=1 Tax=Actinidia rufa TaxID=165716 RepID=A0A7J0ENE3_9ERIC|nr:structural maintenance of chromosome 3 [Actinidia rufa]
MVVGYQPSRRGTTRLAAYSLTQQTVLRESTSGYRLLGDKIAVAPKHAPELDYNRRTVVLSELGRLSIICRVSPYRSIAKTTAVETEIFRHEFAKVRVELEPWEKQLIEHKGKLDVACTESNCLNEKWMLKI